MFEEILKRVEMLERIEKMKEAREARKRKLIEKNLYVDEAIIEQKIYYAKR